MVSFSIEALDRFASHDRMIVVISMEYVTNSSFFGKSIKNKEVYSG